MRIRSLIWGSLAVVLMVSGVVTQAAAAGGDEAAVAASEHQWLKAQQTNDSALLAPLLADKVVYTNDDGKVFAGKRAVLADSKSITWSSVEYTHLSVTVFGHTAIATGTFIGKGTIAGKSMDFREQFTDTWVKMAGGKWQCVATQTSPRKM